MIIVGNPGNYEPIIIPVVQKTELVSGHDRPTCWQGKFIDAKKSLKRNEKL